MAGAKSGAGSGGGQSGQCRNRRLPGRTRLLPFGDPRSRRAGLAAEYDSERFRCAGGSRLDLGQGALTPTGNPLDLAIEGDGFFAIQTQQGVRYTRDGQFHRAQDGTLTTQAGEPVLDARRQPVRVPAGPITVGSDGAVSVNGAIAGRLATFAFASAQDLTAEGSNRYASTSNAQPSPGNGAMHQGALEASNQDVIEGSLQLVLMQRQAEMMEKAVSMFSNDLDKAASEDLPRVP